MKPRDETLPVAGAATMLTDPHFVELADLPPEAEWFANIGNPHTRRAYQNDVKAFFAFAGVSGMGQIRDVRRSHLIAWRDEMNRRKLSPATVRRKLAALSSLYNYLCDCNAVALNPADGVRRPSEGLNEGKTPAISDDQARALLDAPDLSKVKGLRDAAILACFLYSGIRVEELTKLRVRDIEERRGAKFFQVQGKGSKIRYVLVHPVTLGRIHDYLEKAGHGEEFEEPLFRSSVKRRRFQAVRPLNVNTVFKMIRRYGLAVGIPARQLSPHVLRTTLITNALEHEADIAKVQELAGHASIATTRLYDRRQSKPEDSPVNLVAY